MVERGHTVTVLTGQPNYSLRQVLRWLRLERTAPGNARGCYGAARALVARPGGGLQLILNYMSFVIAGCWVSCFDCRAAGVFDGIFVFEPSPITVGIPAALAAGATVCRCCSGVPDVAGNARGSRRRPRVVDVAPDRLAGAWCTGDGSRPGAIPRVHSRHRASRVPAEAIRYFPNWGEAVFDALPAASASDRSSGFRCCLPETSALPRTFRRF